MRTTFIALSALLLAAAAGAQTTVRCESSSGNYVECRTNLLSRVTLSQQLSDASCVQGQTWGFRDNVIWVDRGCRADFLVTEANSVAPTTNETLVVCESLNGKYHPCHMTINGGVRLVRQLSDNQCIRGESWGINQRGIWVDRGCRGEFAIGATSAAALAPPNTTLVVCESGGGKRRCPVDTSAGVRISQQLSKHSCALGRDWGYDENGIWVTNGCRAEFIVNSPVAGSMASASTRPVILCQSNDGHRNFCPADTTLGVTLSRQLSETNCVRGQTWGYDNGGVWVTGGCRAEFLLDSPR